MSKLTANYYGKFAWIHFMMLLIMLSTIGYSIGCIASPQSDNSKQIIMHELESQISRGVYQLFRKLLERDGHSKSFYESKERVASLCIDWSSTRKIRDAEFYSVQYWIKSDEGSIQEMEESLSNKCSEWKTANKKPCECETFQDRYNPMHVTFQNSYNPKLFVPSSVIESFYLSKRSYELVTSQTYLDRLNQIEEMRKNDGFLSENTKSPYSSLKLIQESICKKYPGSSMGCKFDKTQCIAVMEKQGEILGYSDPEPISIACTQISTPYEMPGIYEMLHRFNVEILTAAEIKNIQIPESFAYGSFSKNVVNVSITDKQHKGARIMLFDQKFFSFVYEMAKVAALTLPFENRTSEIISLDSDEERLVSYLNKNPEIERIFIETVLTFLDYADRPPLPPKENIRPILITYTYGIEQFAMAHEVGHSVMGHQAESSLNLDGTGCSNPSDGNWIEEIEADYIGFELLKGVKELKSACSGAFIDDKGGLSVIGKPIDHCESHPFTLVLPLTPEFYFLARQVSQEACDLINGAIEEPDVIENKVIDFAKKCSENSSNCNFIQDVRKVLPSELIKRKGHPHPSIRKQLVNIWASDLEINRSDNVINAIGNSLIRNTSIIWNKARSKYEDDFKKARKK